MRDALHENLGKFCYERNATQWSCLRNGLAECGRSVDGIRTDPIRRKEAEQLQNAEKSAEFDMLKVRLEQLESSAGKLADDQSVDALDTQYSV